MCGQSVKQTAKVYFYFSTMGPNTFGVSVTFLRDISLINLICWYYTLKKIRSRLVKVQSSYTILKIYWPNCAFLNTDVRKKMHIDNLRFVYFWHVKSNKLEIKSCGLGSRNRDMEAFWYQTEIKVIYWIQSICILSF